MEKKETIGFAAVLWILFHLGVVIVLSGYLAWVWVSPESFWGVIPFLLTWCCLGYVARLILGPSYGYIIDNYPELFGNLTARYSFVQKLNGGLKFASQSIPIYLECSIVASAADGKLIHPLSNILGSGLCVKFQEGSHAGQSELLKTCAESIINKYLLTLVKLGFNTLYIYSDIRGKGIKYDLKGLHKVYMDGLSDIVREFDERLNSER